MTYAKAKERTRVRDKHQTPSQRITNAMWLRSQITALVTSCDENIAEDQELADKARDSAKRDMYQERVASHQHWKRQLERILTGKTFTEDLRDAVKPMKWSLGS